MRQRVGNQKLGEFLCMHEKHLRLNAVSQLPPKQAGGIWQSSTKVLIRCVWEDSWTSTRNFDSVDLHWIPGISVSNSHLQWCWHCSREGIIQSCGPFHQNLHYSPLPLDNPAWGVSEMDVSTERECCTEKQSIYWRFFFFNLKKSNLGLVMLHK